ncbi:hypothetical protein MTO96_037541, partial [Rhipicephalus appendiculatus]
LTGSKKPTVGEAPTQSHLLWLLLLPLLVSAAVVIALGAFRVWRQYRLARDKPFIRSLTLATFDMPGVDLGSPAGTIGPPAGRCIRRQAISAAKPYLRHGPRDVVLARNSGHSPESSSAGSETMIATKTATPHNAPGCIGHNDQPAQDPTTAQVNMESNHVTTEVTARNGQLVTNEDVATNAAKRQRKDEDNVSETTESCFDEDLPDADPFITVNYKKQQRQGIPVVFHSAPGRSFWRVNPNVLATEDSADEPANDFASLAVLLLVPSSSTVRSIGTAVARSVLQRKELRASPPLTHLGDRVGSGGGGRVSVGWSGLVKPRGALVSVDIGDGGGKRSCGLTKDEYANSERVLVPVTHFDVASRTTAESVSDADVPTAALGFIA